MTNPEWEILAPLVPAAQPGGRPRSQDMREVINAILYVLRTGCPWRFLAHEFPKGNTVYDSFWQWRHTGTWEEINRT